MKQDNPSNNQPASAQHFVRTDHDAISDQGCGIVKAFHYQQIALLVEREYTNPTTEPCLSPLLWSESFGLRLDG